MLGWGTSLHGLFRVVDHGHGIIEKTLQLTLEDNRDRILEKLVNKNETITHEGGERGIYETNIHSKHNYTQPNN